jgi:hypothetical protein
MVTDYTDLRKVNCRSYLKPQFERTAHSKTFQERLNNKNVENKTNTIGKKRKLDKMEKNNTQKW